MVAFSELKPSATGLELDVRVDGTNDKSSSIITPPSICCAEVETEMAAIKAAEIKNFFIINIIDRFTFLFGKRNLDSSFPDI